ncbi:MAG: class I SAM-dependent methyltransferase [Rubrivivax sp.]|jgi:SAM-dependent methyltransferase|nr:class I SAM-dependent methyltransferase [Rubrivivax sp.]
MPAQGSSAVVNVEAGAILELGTWLTSAPGTYVLQWEQQRLDEVVADRFGFHALQLGLPSIDALRANRMPYRWVADEAVAAGDGRGTRPVALHCHYDALPFPSHSIDLVVMPHTLELTRDPHLALREVERVLVPEGRVVITGFNPASLWGVRQQTARRDPFLPRAGEFIGYWRLRDWLRLLGFELEEGHFGCYRPPLRSEIWLQRWAWMDRIGDRWWPVFGATYQIEAVKRVRGMRLVGVARRDRRKVAATAAAVNREHEPVTRWPTEIDA